MYAESSRKISDKNKQSQIEVYELDVRKAQIELEQVLKNGNISLQSEADSRRIIEDLKIKILLLKYSKRTWKDIRALTESQLPDPEKQYKIYQKEGSHFVNMSFYGSYIDDTVDESIINLYPDIFTSNKRRVRWQAKILPFRWVMTNDIEVE